MKRLLLLLAVIFFAGCNNDTPIDLSDPAPNILLIIADDMGKDATSGFSEGTIKPQTPHIDGIRDAGVSFTNCWVYPTCSPTRASIITGKYGYRTGVKWAGDELSATETTLQQYINQNSGSSYATAIVGKWHLSGANTSVNPLSFGLDYYAGLFTGAAQSYYSWDLTEGGTTTTSTTYATKKITDLAIDWIQQQDQPWFMWLAYNAPHTPFHVPPSAMHQQGNLSPYTAGANALPYYMAAIEAMDYQIGRLLDNLPEGERENTLVIFIGDNGTPQQVVQAPYSSATAKGSLYQGGINVPLYVSGKGVSRTGTDNNLIGSSDLFATIATLTGASTDAIHDSKSFHTLLTQSAELRGYQYSEMNDGSTDAWTIRNAAYKLLVFANGNQELYHLSSDPYEQTNLLLGTLTAEQSTAKADLEAELARIRN